MINQADRGGDGETGLCFALLAAELVANICLASVGEMEPLADAARMDDLAS